MEWLRGGAAGRGRRSVDNSHRKFTSMHRIFQMIIPGRQPGASKGAAKAATALCKRQLLRRHPQRLLAPLFLPHAPIAFFRTHRPRDTLASGPFPMSRNANCTTAASTRATGNPVPKHPLKWYIRDESRSYRRQCRCTETRTRDRPTIFPDRIPAGNGWIRSSSTCRNTQRRDGRWRADSRRAPRQPVRATCRVEPRQWLHERFLLPVLATYA